MIEELLFESKEYLSKDILSKFIFALLTSKYNIDEKVKQIL